jgi:hypothetical protein
MKKKIIIIGRSQKFIKIIKKLYIHDEISILAWRKLDKPNKYRSHKNPNIIFVCGYDYNSHWYDYTKYYKTNISSPLKFINSTCNKNTFLFYIDTVSKLKKKTNAKRLILSRYVFAKKKLRNGLIKKFDKIKIIELPPLIDDNLEVSIFGGKFTRVIFKFLITIKIVNSIKLQSISNKFLIKNNFNKRYKLHSEHSFMLNIPRPLFIDRLLRIISS